MSRTSEVPKTVLQRLLDAVERVGNEVPHPAVLFSLLMACVIVLSQLLHWLGVRIS